MNVLIVVLGCGLIVVGFYDMYHSLLHPSGKGPLSSRVMAGVWRISRTTGHRFGSSVGPGAMVLVIVLWVSLQGVGWALIYLPQIPDGFIYSPGLDPSDYPDPLGALYVSLVTLATLGFGDVVATDPWIRIATPLEALTGFALLTAALTWFTQVYPPLSRRRALALELKSLADVNYADGIGHEDPTTAAGILDNLTTQIIKARIDFTQHAETYYFQEEDPGLSLARQLDYAVELRDKAAQADLPHLHSSTQRLGVAFNELAANLRSEFLTSGNTPREIFSAYAHDHQRATRS